MKQSTSWKSLAAVAAVLVCGGILLVSGGCKDRTNQRRMVTGIGSRKTDDTAFLVEGVADVLNNLQREIVLELTPPRPILDDAKSADGQPVLATCSVTPKVENGNYNFFSIPKGNANFRRIGVRAGDMLRYFVKYDEESAEHGFGEFDYFELIVRRLDQFNPDNALIVEGGLNGPVDIPTRIEIWRFDDKRMVEIEGRVNDFLTKSRPRIGWEPSADESALLQLIERANQWLRNAEDEITWQADPRIADLPKDIRESKPIATEIAPKELQSGAFRELEARQLQQAIWLRDISRWAKGEAISPVDVARALFDWSVRNIQLDDPNKTPGYVHQPWQALLYGHGTAKQRAWIFAELCRQQQLDVVMLSTDKGWWLPALLQDGELYLFDTQLGLPIPSKTSGTVCTLSELIENPELLEQLSIEGEPEYPIAAADLSQVSAELVASPLQLSKRALALQEAFESDEFVVLAANTLRIAKDLEAASGISNVGLWAFPFESILSERSMSEAARGRGVARFYVFAQLPKLWKARVLHFQGTKDVPFEQRNDPLAQAQLGHQKATALYQGPRIRPSNARLKTLEPAKRLIYQRSKADASYWLGLLSFDQGKYRIAADWFARRTLDAIPNGPWTQGARYNLARTYEAMGELDKAVELLEEGESPQRLGNLIRAKQLKAQLKPSSDASEE